MLAIKLIVQMIAVTYLPNKYLVWLALELIFAILASLALNICIKHSAPYLRKVNKPYSYFKEKYPLILTKIKQLIYHKIGLFSLQQTTPLIVYGFASLSVVTRYFNYYLIFLAGTDILRSVMESLTGSIGNLVNNADKKKYRTRNVVSEFLIVFLWKPFFLYYKALHNKFLEYLHTLALH